MPDRKRLEQALGDALAGTGAHAETRTVFESLDWTLAGQRPGGAPHSVYQLLNHIVFWQDWVVRWLDGAAPVIPEHASVSWPGAVGPATSLEWDEAVARFADGLEALERRALEGDLLAPEDSKSRIEMLHTIASHNSYHAGQVVLLRQMLGAWPPPSGGLTW